MNFLEPDILIGPCTPMNKILKCMIWNIVEYAEIVCSYFQSAIEIFQIFLTISTKNISNK